MPRVDAVCMKVLPALGSAPYNGATTAEIFTADRAVAFYGSTGVGMERLFVWLFLGGYLRDALFGLSCVRRFFSDRYCLLSKRRIRCMGSNLI